MKKIFKIIPILLFPLLLTSCNLFKPATNSNSETTSVDPTSAATTDVDGVSISIEGSTQATIGETIKLVLNMSDVSMIPTTITWSTSNSSILARGTPNKNDHSCTFTGASEGSATVTAKGKLKNTERTPFEITFDVSVSKPALTGIKLNITEKTLGYDKTLNLTASPLPSAADLPDINWSTSNASAGTLSATTGATVTFTAGSSDTNTVITAKTSDNAFSATCNINVQAISLDAYTLLFYVCGSSLESGSDYSDYGYDPETNPMGCATSDIAEILSTNGQPEGVNIVLICGGSESWKNTKIKAHQDKLSYWHVENKNLVWDKDESLANMGASSTLQSFLEYGFEHYAAEKYGLFMWNHGGAMNGCCYDELFGNDSLLNSEVYNAVTTARSNQGISEKLEFIAYDACLMAVQDVAEYNSYNFNYMISSQETEWDGGYDYDAWLPTLYANPTGVNTVTLLTKIADTFMDYFESAGYHDQTQSVYDLGKIATYKSAFESLASGLNSLVTNSTKLSTLKSAVKAAKTYGGGSYYVYDAIDALDRIANKSDFSSLSSQITTVKNALTNSTGGFVVYNRCGSKTGIVGSCGLNIYCPSYGSKSSYLSQSHFTSWADLIYKY